jgi:REP element-mobilizing transposase RayT
MICIRSKPRAYHKDCYDALDGTPAGHSAKPWQPLPRQARFALPHMPAHVLQRGQNRAPVCFEAQDSLEDLTIVQRVADACHCAIQASVLLTTPLHLLRTPEAGDTISRLSQVYGVTSPHVEPSPEGMRQGATGSRRRYVSIPGHQRQYLCLSAPHRPADCACGWRERHQGQRPSGRSHCQDRTRSRLSSQRDRCDWAGKLPLDAW